MVDDSGAMAAFISSPKNLNIQLSPHNNLSPYLTYGGYRVTVI